MPAVILVGGPGRQDRDETLYGVPCSVTSPARLAEPVISSSGTTSAASVRAAAAPNMPASTEYAGDVPSIVKWLRTRKDVDPNRIAVLTHGDGSAVGMLAAGRKKEIRALGVARGAGSAGPRSACSNSSNSLLARRNAPNRIGRRRSRCRRA